MLPEGNRFLEHVFYHVNTFQFLFNISICFSFSYFITSYYHSSVVNDRVRHVLLVTLVTNSRVQTIAYSSMGIDPSNLRFLLGGFRLSCCIVCEATYEFVIIFRYISIVNGERYQNVSTAKPNVPVLRHFKKKGNGVKLPLLLNRKL